MEGENYVSIPNLYIFPAIWNYQALDKTSFVYIKWLTKQDRKRVQGCKLVFFIVSLWQLEIVKLWLAIKDWPLKMTLCVTCLKMIHLASFLKEDGCQCFIYWNHFGGSHNISKLKSSDKYAEKGKNYLLKWLSNKFLSVFNFRP